MSEHLFAFLRQLFTFLCIDLSVTLALMLLFGVIAPSTSGIYGVMSFAVTTDAGVGIRMALVHMGVRSLPFLI